MARHRSWIALVAVLLGAWAAEPAHSGPWVGANPGAGGAFTSIGAGPTGIILCGSDLGGAYRSLDGGQNWDAIGPARGMPVAHVSAVGFDPTDPAIAYLGTEHGVYRSTDSGATWRLVSGTPYIAAIAPAPSNPSIVYAPNHPQYNSPQTGLLKSTDRGQTFITVSTNLPGTLRVTKLIVDPTNPSTLYLVSGKDLFISGALSSIWKSLDGGATWTMISASVAGAQDLAIDPATPTTLYATTPTSTWKSTDGGATWLVKGTHGGCVTVKRDRPQTVRVIDPSRDPGDSQAGLWESTNGGDTWTHRGNPDNWGHGWQTLSWAYGPGGYGVAKVFGQSLSEPDVLLRTHWQFVFRSNDGGAQFEDMFAREVSPGWWITRGIENVAVTAVAISEADTSRIYTGYYDIGMWRSQDGGRSWQTSNQESFTGAWKGHGGCTVSILPDPSRPSVVFATMGEMAHVATVVKSTNAGAAGSWVGANGGLPSGFVSGLSMDRSSPSSNRTLFVTSGGDVYKSVDDGASWTMVLSGSSCRVTAVDRFDGNRVYAGGEGGLWRSTAGGAAGSWTQIGPAAFTGSNGSDIQQIQWTGIHAITPDPRTPGRVWVAAYGSGKGIYLSLDGGATWTQKRSGTYFRGVAVDPQNAGVVFATSSKAYKAGGSIGGSEGILRSADDGASWTQLDGLPWPFAGPVALNPLRSSKLIVGSPGTGFWIRELASAADTQPPAAVKDLSAP